MIPLFTPPPAAPMRHPTSFPQPVQQMPLPPNFANLPAPTTYQGQYPQNLPAQTRTDSLVDAPPLVGTVTLSQLANLRSSNPPLVDTSSASQSAPQYIPAVTSSALQAPPSQPLSPYGQPLSTYGQGFQHITPPSAPPSSGGTLSFSISSSQSVPHPSSRQAFVHLANLVPTSSDIGTASAPNGIGTFASFSVGAPATPNQISVPSAPPTHYTQSSMTGSMFLGMPHASDVSHALPQPAISISICDPPNASNPSSNSRKGSVTAKTSGGYIPAPGQALVNMDKTTLFTPTNPPRPGSPRTPRTPKSPKSPGSTTPHSPKSPKPDT